jgi:cytochrome P450 family 142 subfamily A polypeptide 1
MSTRLSDARPAFDLLDPGFYVADPHAAYRWMRAHAPVYRDERNGLWAVSRHRDVLDVERRPDVFVNRLGYRSVRDEAETTMISQDDPRHLQQRRLVSAHFTPRAVSEHESFIRGVVTELVDAVADAGRMEVVGDLAAPVPARLTARLLGLPEARWPDIRSWSERLMRYDLMASDQAALAGMMDACEEYIPLLRAALPERQGCPADDLISAWANAEIDGERLDFMTVMYEMGLVISGGAETTRTVIARALRTFCDHPDQWERLATEPELMPRAVEEMIRWVTPLHNMFRTATRDAEIGDQSAQEGDRVVLLYPSANRDERVFGDPDRFDVARDPNPHVAFGNGTHFCLGASLARLELRVVFEELTSRLTDLRALDEPDDEPNIFVAAVRSFPLGFRRR